MARGRRLRSAAGDGDKEWDEVKFINSYAVFMGHLSMGIRGLGLLVVTWTTVVLLGGFVSVLRQKDFWCLTVITLIQTAGVFDFFLKETLRNIWHAYLGLFVTVVFDDKPETTSWNLYVVVLNLLQAMARALVGLAIAGVQAVLFSIILLPIAALYMCGLYISTMISLWRLIQRDYGGDDGDGSKTNLKPALVVLYSLSLFQGVLFCYKTIVSYAEKKITNRMAQEYKFRGLAHESLSDYLDETRIRCEKDPSFTRGRNLIKYAVDLMASNSPRSFVSGVMILDVLTGLQMRSGPFTKPEIQEMLLGRHTLIKQLLAGSASSSYIISKLLMALDLRSPYDRTTRACAARIVACVAGDIYLERFPRGIQSIASLLGSFREYQLIEPYERDWVLETYEPECLLETHEEVLSWCQTRHKEDEDKLQEAYKNLLLQGMRILRKLATDEGNCKIMSSTRGLLSKIMAPLSSDLLHGAIDHDDWCRTMVDGSLRVMWRLVSAPGESGMNLRRGISSCKEVIARMEGILKCHKCKREQYELAIKILAQLSIDGTASSLATQSRENFINFLVGIFVDDKDSSIHSPLEHNSIRRLAAQKLVVLSFQSETNAKIILQANDDIVDILVKLLLQHNNNIFRLSAAEILEHLCSHYKKDDDYFRKLDKSMKNVMPKVLREVLPCKSTGNSGQVGFSSLDDDIEGQQGGESHDNGQTGTSSHQENAGQLKDRKLEAALLSLCVTICDTLVSADQDLTLQLDAIFPEDDAFSFPGRLKQMVETNCQRLDDCLVTIKLICKMVISMMKHGGSYVQGDLESLMKSVSTASRTMWNLECSMVFASGSDGTSTNTNKHVRTLSSLLKEAEELVHKREAR